MARTPTNPSSGGEPNPTYGVVATVVCAGLVTALSLYLAGGLIARFMPAKKCNDANPCESGLRCDQSSGKCVKPPPEQMVCRAGDLEGTCFCPAPRSWIDGECQYKPPPPAECDAATSELLAELLQTQKDCRKELQADATSCAPGDIRKFMLKNQQFNAILNEFSATTWVLFPAGKPPLKGRWPAKQAELEHYAAGLKYDEALLEEASSILILAHALNDNDSKNDLRLQKRLEHGYKLIQELAGDDVAKRNRWQRKFLAFPIPPDNPARVDDFLKTQYANIVTWDDESQVHYGTLLKAARDGGDINASQWEELGGALNMSVTIVPIRCDPPPSAENAG